MTENIAGEIGGNWFSAPLHVICQGRDDHAIQIAVASIIGSHPRVKQAIQDAFQDVDSNPARWKPGVHHLLARRLSEALIEQPEQ
jgi:hypothetical protein